MSSDKEARLLKSFGKRLAEVRRARDLTQEQLAERADVTSLSISYIEQGRRWPRIATIEKLARCLDVSIADLFKGL